MGRPFWTLAGASGLSNLADGIAKVALPLLALRYTRSPALVGGLEVVRTLPWLLLALHAGAIVDHIDRRRTMVVANVVRAASVAGVALVVAADVGSIWWLYLAAAVSGVAEVFHDTAGQSMLPALLDRDRLDRANGRLFAVELGAQELVGPPLGGVLVAASATVAFGSSAGLWALGLVALLSLRGTFRAARSGPATTLLADVREGLRFVFGRPVLRTMALMVGISNFASSATFGVFVVYAVGEGSELGLSEGGFGALFAATAVGGLLGGLVADRAVSWLGRSRALFLSMSAIGVWVAMPAITTSVPVLAATFVVGGAVIMVWNVVTVSFRQRVTPDRLLGRVNSGYRLLAWGTRPAGALAGGLLGEAIGVRPVFAVMGALCLVILVPGRRLTEEALAATERASARSSAPGGP